MNEVAHAVVLEFTDRFRAVPCSAIKWDYGCSAICGDRRVDFTCKDDVLVERYDRMNKSDVPNSWWNRVYFRRFEYDDPEFVSELEFCLGWVDGS